MLVETLRTGVLRRLSSLSRGFRSVHARGPNVLELAVRSFGWSGVIDDQHRLRTLFRNSRSGPLRLVPALRVARVLSA